MLMANIQTKRGLVNGIMGVIHDILYRDHGPPLLPIAVFIKFNKYERSNIIILQGDKIIPIVPIKRTQEGKSGMLCFRLQVPLYLAQTIMIYKNQGLTLEKAKINLGSKKFAAGFSFVVILRIWSLNDIYFKQFIFEYLQCIKNSRRL